MTYKLNPGSCGCCGCFGELLSDPYVTSYPVMAQYNSAHVLSNQFQVLYFTADLNTYCPWLPANGIVGPWLLSHDSGTTWTRHDNSDGNDVVLVLGSNVYSHYYRVESLEITTSEGVDLWEYNADENKLQYKSGPAGHAKDLKKFGDCYLLRPWIDFRASHTLIKDTSTPTGGSLTVAGYDFGTCSITNWQLSGSADPNGTYTLDTYNGSGLDGYYLAHEASLTVDYGGGDIQSASIGNLVPILASQMDSVPNLQSELILSLWAQALYFNNAAGAGWGTKALDSLAFDVTGLGYVPAGSIYSDLVSTPCSSGSSISAASLT